MSEERDDIVILIDEEGEEVEFEHLDTIEMNGSEYVVLLPIDQENEEMDEVVILKVEHGENGEDSFITVDDDEELDAVFAEFQARMEDDEDDYDGEE